MNRIRRNLNPKIRPPLWAKVLMAILLTAAVTVLTLWCQPNSLRVVLARFWIQPGLIILNALPIGLLVLMLTCLFRNVFISAALVNFAACALSIANRIKIEVRDEPLFPRDFALLKEAGSALHSYGMHFPWGIMATAALVTLILLGMGFWAGKHGFQRKHRIFQRLRSLLGAAASLGVLIVLILTVYASNGLYHSFAVTNAYHIPSVFNELGFPYCFCRHFTTYPIEKPEGFKRSEAEKWESGNQSGLGKDVNVIMVMNEAFSDITDNNVFTYSKEDDPLTNLHDLRADPHTISGHVIVPCFAGGTANTEFDILTGMQTNAIGAASAFRVVNRNLDSLFRVFGDDRYHTSFFHPGKNWFYNRENVYRWLGADETLFDDDMAHLKYKGSWVTDDAVAELIEAKFERAAAANKLLFNYTTTIQNHMSYTIEKYGKNYDYPAVETSASLSEEAETLLKVYIEGVRDADAMLGRLATYFSARTEPVVLVFLGDHLPYLGDNKLTYTEIGLENAVLEDDRAVPLCPFEIPYIIWTNDAAADTLDWKDKAPSLDLPENGKLSASFLGAAVLELTGRTGESPWFDFLNQLRREFPVIQKQTYMTQEGEYIYEDNIVHWNSSNGISGNRIWEMVQKWRRWSYYKLRYKELG